MREETTLTEIFALLGAVLFLFVAYTLTYDVYGPSPDVSEPLFSHIFITAMATFGGLLVAYFLILFLGIRERKFMIHLLIYFLASIVTVSLPVVYIVLFRPEGGTTSLAWMMYSTSLLLALVTVVIGKLFMSIYNWSLRTDDQEAS